MNVSVLAEQREYYNKILKRNQKLKKNRKENSEKEREKTKNRKCCLLGMTLTENIRIKEAEVERMGQTDRQKEENGSGKINNEK